MLSIIKTAIITIIISFISGVLLDSYKNFAPRILCSMEKPVRLKINNKRVWAFTFIMRNISNKTIHNLSLNIQGHYDNLRIDEAKITKGLKFETSSENNSYNVSIPFLSKDDEFSTKIFVENSEGTIKKPVVTLRSPENFKQVNGFCKNGYFATIAGIPKDISESITKRKRKNQKTNNENKKVNIKDKSFFNYRTILLTMMGIVVLIYAVIWINKLHDNGTDKFTVDDNKVITQQPGDSLKQEESSIKSSTPESKTNLGGSKSTGSTESSNEDSVSNKNKVSNDSSNKKILEDSNKNSKDTKTSNDTKGSNSSAAKKNNTTSASKDETQIDNKNSKTENNKTSSSKDSTPNKSGTNNTQSNQQNANSKIDSDKTGEQEKSKLQGSESSSQEQQKTSTSVTEDK